jgi:hypothetical protein
MASPMVEYRAVIEDAIAPTGKCPVWTYTFVVFTPLEGRLYELLQRDRCLAQNHLQEFEIVSTGVIPGS